jgi:Xaa-Pro aminopeptidase
MGAPEKLQTRAEKSGIKRVKPLSRLDADICKALARNRMVHYIPVYSETSRLQISYYTNVKYEEVDSQVSQELIRAVVAQRSIKDELELQDMERTMTEVTGPAYAMAAGNIRSGRTEHEVAGTLEGAVLSRNCRMAYPVICSVRGEILHNHHYGNKLEEGQLLLIDAGAESCMHYATDITRTYPVDGKFSQQQKDIYQIVLDAQLESIQAVKPGVPYRDIHFIAALSIVEGLKGLGIMKGHPEDAVRSGAHALFFPHGIGHMIGLDVHDMENLGEDHVGYDDEFTRSDQFGTAYLRMAKRLLKGHVLTVEPGIYFIPSLMDQWQGEGKFRDFIDYEEVRKYAGFGGIRIEDNIVVTEDGHLLIGDPIPKEADAVEAFLKG